jgi:SAM-dependent methyltransferase
VVKVMIGGGLRLWRNVLAFVPDSKERGKLLELGSPPFNMTLLLEALRNYDLTLTGAATDGRAEITRTVESPEYGEKHTFRCQTFDLEKDRFPYEDDSFDLVTWVEVLEHLTLNPVHALAEIHRVLKPGGAVVITTPNVTRLDNIVKILKGRNIYDPYHLGSELQGSRHSREYTLRELRDLLEGCGFAIERAENLDIYPAETRRKAAARWFMAKVVARLTGGTYRFNLFVRARKTERPFRWYFPPGLFDAGHLAFYLAPRDTWMTIGENDAIHRSFGWNGLTTGPDGKAMRRSGEVGDVYLLSEGPLSKVTVTVAGGKGLVQAWHDNGGAIVELGVTPVDVPAGAWSEVTVALNDKYEPGNRLHVRFECPEGIDVHAVRAE